jgi:hypothetical protein
MAICRLILKLTGEELPDIYWTSCVQIIRTFFDLWLFLDLENSGALPTGFLVQRLEEAAATAGPVASSGGVIAQAVRDYDGFDWVLTIADDGANRGQLQTRSKSGGVTLMGRGCAFSFGNKTATVDVHWRTIPVPGDGSCMIASIARTLARVDLPSLKQQTSLHTVKWEPFDEWAAYGKSLLRSVDPCCTETREPVDPYCVKLRERICRLLWNNADRCKTYIPFAPDIKDNGDIAPAQYKKALQTATNLGLLGEGASVDAEEDIVKGWAVALLDQRTHCTEAVMRALLATDFEDAMGILVAGCHRTASTTKKDAYVHRILEEQPMVPDGALIVIGIHHHAAYCHLSEEENHKARECPKGYAAGSEESSKERCDL